MKAKEIQELIDFISKSGLDEVNIETEQFKIKVRKNSEVKQQIITPTTPTTIAVPAATPAAAPVATEENGTSPAAEPATEPSKNGYTEIKSPMIGTFYRAAGPDTEAFVVVGDKISVGQTVCIVEAMKLFNEIESEVAGTIIKVLVDNSTPVEYDQPLFLIDPA